MSLTPLLSNMPCPVFENYLPSLTDSTRARRVPGKRHVLYRICPSIRAGDPVVLGAVLSAVLAVPHYVSTQLFHRL